MKNQIVIEGTCGRDAEKRSTANGLSIASVSIANTEKWLDKKTQTEQKRTTWLRVTAFGDRADELVDIAVKGNTIEVEGKISLNEYTDKKTGSLKQSLDVTMFRCNLVRESKKKDAPANAPTRELSFGGQKFTQPKVSPDYAGDSVPF